MNKDQIKEEIGFAKVVFSLSSVIEVSLLAWIAQNFNHTSVAMSLLSLLLAVLMMLIIVKVTKFIYIKINQLGEQ